MVQSSGPRTSDVLTSRSTDVLQPPPNHDHARDALRLALGSILTPKRTTSNPGNPRSASSSGTASPAHFPFPYGSHAPSQASSSHPHGPQHLHHPHGHSHLVPSHAQSHSPPSSTSHSPHSSSPPTPVTESTSSPNPFLSYPRPGLLSRSISSSSTQSIGRSPSALNGHGGSGTTESAVPSPPPATPSVNPNAGSGAGTHPEGGIHAPAPQTAPVPVPVPVPVVTVTTSGGTAVVAKNKFIQTLEAKTPRAWDALIHGSFS